MAEGADKENICIDCGLCCDGTLFSFVEIKEEDDLDTLTALGFTFVENNEAKGFSQPCRHFHAGQCGVYEERPSVCRTYSCALRRKYDADDISASDAKEIIQQMTRMDWRKTIGPDLEAIAGMPNESLRTLLHAANGKIKASDDPVALRRRYGKSLVRAASIFVFMEKHFQHRKNKTPG